MTTKSSQQAIIESTDDMTSGGGLGATVGKISVERVSVGTDVFGEDMKNESFLNAHVAITIDYEAGYAITGNYMYESKDPNIDVSTLESRVDYAKNGLFDFDIKYQKDDEKPFDNWYVVAKNEEVLSDIAIVGSECYDEDDSVTYSVNEAFGFDYDAACQEVAYQMLGNISPTNIRSDVQPFSKQFVKDMDAKARQAIADFLTASAK